MSRDAYIVEAVRTPIGRRKGMLSGWHPADLLAEVRILRGLLGDAREESLLYVQGWRQGWQAAHAEALALLAAHHVSVPWAVHHAFAALQTPQEPPR